MKMISGDRPKVRDNIRVTKEERIKRIITNYCREKLCESLVGLANNMGEQKHWVIYKNKLKYIKYNFCDCDLF